MSPFAPHLPFTAGAYAQMQQELAQFEQEELAILERLKVAREMGDLSENGAYKYAKFELGRVRRELGRLRRLLEQGYVVESKTQYDRVEFGCAVTVEHDGVESTFQVVGKHESDPTAGKLSQESPLGQALFHAKVGDMVEIDVPAGRKRYLVKHIHAPAL